MPSQAAARKAIRTANYGEGSSFNLPAIQSKISQRIEKLESRDKIIEMMHDAEDMGLYDDNLDGEQLKCECKQTTFTRTVDENYNPTCGKCGRTI